MNIHLAAQTTIRERVEISPREPIVLPPPLLSEESGPTLLRQLSATNVGFTRPGVQVTITAIDVSIPPSSSKAGLKISVSGSISGASALKQVVMCNNNYITTNYQTLPYNISANSCSNFFYVYYNVLSAASFQCNVSGSLNRFATVQVNGSEAVFTIQDTVFNQFVPPIPVSATITVTATSLSGYELATVTSAPNRTTLQCFDTTRVNINAYNGLGQLLTVCGGPTLPATVSLLDVGEYAFLRKDSLEGQSIPFMMNSGSSSFDVVLDTSRGVIPYGNQQATLRVDIDGVTKDTVITFTCNYPQPSVTITYPSQDTTIIVTPEYQPTLNLQEIHSPTEGQFQAQVSWEPGLTFNSADYYDQIDDSLVIPVIATATNIAQFEVKDTVKITLKKNPIDHFVLTFEKDTVAYNDSSKIFVQAKDSGGVNVDPPSGTLVNILLSEFEQYGFLAYDDSVGLVFQNVPYEDAHSGSVLFTATNQDPGFGTAIVPVGVTKVGQEGVSGVDTVVVGNPITLTISLSPSTVRPVGIGGNNTSVVTVTATRGGAPVEDVPIQLSVEPVEKSGGHDHHDINRPKGNITGAQAQTDSLGKVTATYTSSIVSGKENIKAISTQVNDTSVAQVRVEVENLTNLADVSSNFWKLVGNTGTTQYNKCVGAAIKHPDSHYGTEYMVGQVQLAMLDFFA